MIFSYFRNHVRINRLPDVECAWGFDIKSIFFNGLIPFWASAISYSLFGGLAHRLRYFYRASDELMAVAYQDHCLFRPESKGTLQKPDAGLLGTGHVVRSTGKDKVGIVHRVPAFR